MLQRLCAPAAGLLVGLAVGLIDLTILIAHPRSRGTLAVPDWTWASVPWVWMTVCCLIGIVLSSRPLRRVAGAALVFAGPGVLLLSRAATAVKESTGLSSRQILAAWLVAVLLLAIPALWWKLDSTRKPWLWLGASLLSLALILLSAAQPPDFLARERTPAAATGSRNVVLVFLDTTRYDDSLGSMPRLARFRTNALSFDNAWAPAPWTIPSHFAVLTGLDPHRIPADPETHLYRVQPTMLAQRFDARGYTTSAIFANALLSPDAGFARGYDEFTVVRGAALCRSAIGDLLSRMWIHDGPRSRVCGWFTADDVTDRAVRFIRRAPRPYFLTLNYLDGHDPYYVRPECAKAGYRPLRRMHRETLYRSRPNAPAPAKLAQRAHEQYRRALQCLDRSLGELLDVLERDPDWATTSVVFVADHGEHFGEHGLGSHGNSVYPPVLHVPLFARIAGAAPARVPAAVAIADLYPALVQHLATPSAPFRLLDPARRRPVIGNYEMRAPFNEGGFSFTGDRFHYIRWNSGREALFELGGGEVPLTSQPAWVNVARDAVSRARETRREANEFDALGYLQ
ncbi:MAG TPA: sulfatase-like hydrolase/transferase [Thermoanaerobaculia bacterium]|nr:sulfatase-like hydrolase/transferase [Thermoanaerobaculia bacterium]